MPFMTERTVYRITKFSLQRGAQVHATLTSKHYCRSPLVQEGLEIPCKLEVWDNSKSCNITNIRKTC